MIGGKPVETKENFVRELFLGFRISSELNYCGCLKGLYRNRCATNADWKVNEVNIVLKCCNRFPILKTRPLDGDDNLAIC